jgi:hypothetical protein
MSFNMEIIPVSGKPIVDVTLIVLSRAPGKDARNAV